MERYAIGAFRSRQQVLRFEAVLRHLNIPCRTVSTPREIAIGCGLSVRVDVQNAPKMIAAYRTQPSGNLTGFYIVEAEHGKTRVMPIPYMD